MADGSTGPDLNAIFAMTTNAARMNASGGSGTSPVLACILPGGGRDIQFTNFKLPPGLFGADSMVNKLPQGRPGPIASLLKQMGIDRAQIVADIGKAAQNGGAMYSGSLPTGTNVASNAPVSDGNGPSMSV